ncbi:SURF1 family protein [Roseovarius sp. 2305UL8-3]|uniref:SURF1 family protein n=1 Tax=Roseovarius conchicola TaxID=3121636 RepID=UPI003528CDA0
MQRILIPLIFGLAGAAILIWLGVWQMERLTWKQGVLAEIETRIADASVDLPATANPEADKYLPVRATGQFDEGALRVLVSQKQIGAGYRVISPFQTGDRRILVDRGFIKVDQPIPDAPAGDVDVTGNLHWPDDRNDSTPENDVAGNTWFARDLDQMAGELDSEPVLLVIREMSQPDGALTPLPVDTSGIPNDHLEYAVTWFSLAVVWLIMTSYYIYRSRKPAKGA